MNVFPIYIIEFNFVRRQNIYFGIRTICHVYANILFPICHLNSFDYSNIFLRLCKIKKGSENAALINIKRKMH